MSVNTESISKGEDIFMESNFKPVLTREELAERYNLSLERDTHLLDTFEEIEKAVYRFLSFHL